MSASESFVIPEVSPPASDHDDVDSLASISSGDLSSEGDSDAQREWEASLEQLQLILTMVLIPFAGKYFGRKFAYWSEFWRQSLRGRREARPTDNATQAGRDTWNGSTMSRYDGRARRPSGWSVPSRPLRRYDKWDIQRHSIRFLLPRHQRITGVMDPFKFLGDGALHQNKTITVHTQSSAQATTDA